MLLVGLAALLTIPWAIWVMAAAYQRDIDERASMLANRVRIQMEMAWYIPFPQLVLESLKAELLGDGTVQAVCFYDEQRGIGGRVARDEAIRIPTSIREAEQMRTADPGSYRKVIYIGQGKDGARRAVYLDLSIPALRSHFWIAYRPLLINVVIMTVVGFLAVSFTCILSYWLWTRASRQRQRSEMQRQGLLAERGLTAAVLAHEIRNPLAALRFQLHTLRRNATDAARVDATADTIDTELIRIQKLVSDYLAHEKAQAMRVTAVDLAEAARSLHGLMGELLRQSNTRMTIVERQTSPVTVGCDPHALRQVLMNLVLNAQQAMGEGGSITVTVERQEGAGVISVADTGPGIPEEIRDRLYKPFSTTKQGGSGIGLALVKRFADNFGGSVGFESPPGGGTTFRLSLPLHGTIQTQLPPVQPVVASPIT